ncbi:MAG: flagellar hook-associated protein FlgL [Nitrospirae bacterium]|nr:flagellar hook-associated protein FlgL [Nitrospirota bacterium]
MSRVTTKMIYDTILNSMQDTMKSTASIYEKIASGKKVNRPSDNPTGMSMIMNYNVQISNITQYKRTMSDVKMELKAFETTLKGLSDTAVLAKGVAAKTISMNATDRKAYADTVDSIMSSIIDMANTKSGDKYIYSGQNADSPAIERTTGVYKGGSDYVEAIIGDGVKIKTNIPGNQIFSFSGGPSGSTMPTYNWDNGGAITEYDADSQGGFYTAAGGFTAGTDVFTTNGGTVTINGTAIAIAAGRTLNGVAADINASNASTEVKAAVINFNTTGDAANDDYRLVLGSTSKTQEISKAVISVVSGDAAGVELNSLSGMTLGTNITNYNYITDPSNANYYSFNNNYLNENNFIRAVHFIREAMDNDDTRRISRGSDYLTNIFDNLKSKQIDIGARMDMIKVQENFQISTEATVTTNLSDIRDVQELDYTQLGLQVQLKEQSMVSLRKLSAEFMSSSLFDFI